MTNTPQINQCPNIAALLDQAGGHIVSVNCAAYSLRDESVQS
jgi:hypothetical protein